MTSKDYIAEMIDFYKVDENKFDLESIQITSNVLAYKLPSIFLQIEINLIVDIINQKMLP